MLVELFAKRFQFWLKPIPDNIDLGIVSDGLEGNVRDALVDEALADAVAGGFGVTARGMRIREPIPGNLILLLDRVSRLRES